MAAAVTDTQLSEPPRGVPRRLERWFGPLFPPAVGVERPATTRRVVAVVLAVVAGATLTLFRTGGHGALDTLWAEDARNFVADAFDRPFWHAIFLPVNGYLLVFPRLLTEPVTLAPVQWAAAVIAVEVGVVVAILAVLVFVASRAHLASVPVRLLVAVPLIIAPVGQGGTAAGIAGSVIGNVATLQFPLTYAVFWLLLWSPRGNAGRIVAVGTVVLTAFSTMLTILFLPLALIRVFTRRDRYSAVLLASLAAGAAVQIGALLTGYSERGVGQTRLDFGWAATQYARWLVPNAVLGERWWMSTPDGGRVTLAVIGWLVIAAAVGVALTGLTRPAWPIVAAASAYSLGFVAFELLSFGTAADRYTYLPGLLLLAVLAALVRPRSGGGFAAGPVVLLVVLLMVVCGANFRVHNQRANALSWSASVRAARHQCQITRATWVPVQTHPSRHWAAAIVCSKLR